MLFKPSLFISYFLTFLDLAFFPSRSFLFLLSLSPFVRYGIPAGLYPVSQSHTVPLPALAFHISYYCYIGWSPVFLRRPNLPRSTSLRDFLLRQLQLLGYPCLLCNYSGSAWQVFFLKTSLRGPAIFAKQFTNHWKKSAMPKKDRHRVFVVGGLVSARNADFFEFMRSWPGLTIWPRYLTSCLQNRHFFSFSDSPASLSTGSIWPHLDYVRDNFRRMILSSE